MGWALGYFYGNLGRDWGYLYGNFTSANKGLLCGHDSTGYGASLGYGACGVPQRPCNQPWLWPVTKDEESRFWSPQKRTKEL